jgi:hypothetical protein
VYSQELKPNLTASANRNSGVSIKAAEGGTARLHTGSVL